MHGGIYTLTRGERERIENCSLLIHQRLFTRDDGEVYSAVSGRLDEITRLQCWQFLVVKGKRGLKGARMGMGYFLTALVFAVIMILLSCSIEEIGFEVDNVQKL